MQQINKELPNGTMLFVDVPDDADRFKVFNDLDKPYLSYFVGVETYREYLPKGNWKLLGKSTELTEEQLNEIMPAISTAQLDGVWYSSDGERFIHETALESYNSLKESLGVVDVNFIGEEPKNKDCTCSDCKQDNEVYQEEWNEAQQQVKSYQVLYKKN